MKRSILFVVALFCAIPGLFAKEVKPSLLVYGSGIEAFAAAVQAARSNVPTLWIKNADPSFLQESK
jgi:hypothetical protein